MASDHETPDDDTELLRLSLFSELAQWFDEEPEAAERWSKLRREELQEFRPPA